MLILIFLIIFILIFIIFRISTDKKLENISDNKNFYKLKIKNSRGNIYDCKGKLLAYDTLAYVATFEDTIESDENKNKKLNEIADKAIKIIEKCGDKIVVDFPIVKDQYGNLKYNFTSENQKNLNMLRVA